MHATIKHTILQGLITSIELDPDSNPEFCEACAKAKSTWWLFLKELQTQATQYGECIHWDILGPTLVKSLNRHLYVTAHIDDVTYETMLYFQVKKSDTLQLYKQDKALIETQSYNWIKIVCSDQGEEFLSNEFIQHQNAWGTVHELTVHSSPPQNGTVGHRMWMQALLLASGLPQFLWEEAMKHMTWLWNQTPHMLMMEEHYMKWKTIKSLTSRVWCYSIHWWACAQPTP